jgi:hypothetical protein
VRIRASVRKNATSPRPSRAISSRCPSWAFRSSAA